MMNSRQSNDQLAKRVGGKHIYINYRLKRLNENKTLIR